MILIVANPADVHARMVAKRLREAGRRVEFLDTVALGEGAVLTHPIGNQDPGRATYLGAGRVEAEEVRAVWYRRAPPPSLPAVLDSEDRHFAAAQWARALDGFLLSLDARFVNPLTAEKWANKPRQLELARQAGLRIPETLISNDRARVEEFVRLHSGRVIHKTLSPSTRHLLDTRRWSDEAEAALPDLFVAPAIFQEEIRSPWEARVTVVGDRLFAARFETGYHIAAVDARLDMEVPYEPFDLPPATQRRLLDLMEALGLVFGAIDLKVTEDGDYVFLEVNPQGQFLYVEILTGLPISAAVANLLGNS